MACILITGGTGFIGTAVAKELRSQGHKVKLMDLSNNRKTDPDFYRGSILDPYRVSTVMRGCDYVVHLAAALGVRRTEARRLECLYINIEGTVNVLEACVKENVKKIVFSSSSETYGNQSKSPITEESPVNPISNYATTKLVGEEYFRAYYENYHLDYAVVRFFNVYGEEQRDAFVIPKFVNSVCEKKPPVIYGDGKQVRSFCYVSDAAKGIIAALLNENSAGEIFNIGNDHQPISMKELAEKVISLSDTKGIVPEFIPMEDSDRTKKREVYNRVPSIEKAKRMLQYRPQVSLDEGISKMIKFRSSKRAHRQVTKVK